MKKCYLMKRDIYSELLKWKTSSRRKPLLLQGARQSGKTFLLKEFARLQYSNVAYLNFEEDSSLAYFFQDDLKPERILKELSLYLNLEIRPKIDLLIFDEIQVSNRALNSLKYFAEQKSEIHLAAAGSLLGLKLSRPGSFPVGKVNFLHLYPMTFVEFLDGIGQTKYRALLENSSLQTPLNKALHQKLIQLLHYYYFVGGMPEAVKQFADNEDVIEVRKIQNEIIKSYVMDFAKHAPATDIPKLTSIWESIPKHLAQENKKFVFSEVKRGARARAYEGALNWLKDAGLIYRVNAVESAKHPLRHYTDANCFKLYALDIGILGAMAGTTTELLAGGKRLFNEYQGAFVESYVAQQMAAHFGSAHHYWRSKGGKAELDFLHEFKGEVYPLEVKAGINPKSKSLKSYNLQFQPQLLTRTNLLNLKQNGNILNIPLYLISQLEKFIGNLL